MSFVLVLPIIKSIYFIKKSIKLARLSFIVTTFREFLSCWQPPQTCVDLYHCFPWPHSHRLHIFSDCIFYFFLKHTIYQPLCITCPVHLNLLCFMYLTKLSFPKWIEVKTSLWFIGFRLIIVLFLHGPLTYHTFISAYVVEPL